MSAGARFRRGGDGASVSVSVAMLVRTTGAINMCVLKIKGLIYMQDVPPQRNTDTTRRRPHH
jgi:hypothetical protein